MKISGEFRVVAEDKTVACLRSIFSTVRKLGCDILQIFAATPDQSSPVLLAINALVWELRPSSLPPDRRPPR